MEELAKKPDIPEMPDNWWPDTLTIRISEGSSNSCYTMIYGKEIKLAIDHRTYIDVAVTAMRRNLWRERQRLDLNTISS